MKQTIRIGLTGVMGAGKSSVIEILQQLHITVLDCDEINRKLLKKQASGYQAIVAAFSAAVLDDQGNLDTKKMSDLIFSDAQKKAQAEAILHPLIQKEIKTYCDQCEEALVVVEVPLLFEVHWESFFHEVWVVSCEEELLLERLSRYRHIDRKEALRRMKHQLSAEEKGAKADVILYNNSDKKALQTQLEREIQRLRKG